MTTSALVTITQVQDYLGISTTTGLQTYIDIVSSEIDAYTGRNLSQNVYTDEVLNWTNSTFDTSDNEPLDTEIDYPSLFLSNYPIVGSVAITEDGTAVPTANYSTDTTNGVIKVFSYISDDKDKLLATYTAGYTTTTGQTNTIPSDLRGVALEGVRYMFVNGGTARQGTGNVSSKKVKDFSVSYGDNADNSRYVNTDMGLIKSYIAGNSIILNRYKKISTYPV